jgi:O-antigen ligase
LVAGLLTLVLLAGLRGIAAPLLGAGLAVAALAPSFPAGAPPRPLWAVAGLLAGGVVAVGPRWVRAVALLLPVLLIGSGAALASRVSLASAGRTGALRAALDMVSFTGTGLGRAEFFWLTADGNGQLARYVHNEYVQILVELGVVGLVLLLGVFAACVVTIRAGRHFPHPPGIRAGAIAALVALAVHSGFDFLWHIAVLPLAGALFVGLAGPATREKPTIPTEGDQP